MSLQDNNTRTRLISLSAVFLGISVIISIVESLSGINALIPLPGVKMGFCNIAITACLYLCGVKYALAVAILRPLFLFLFSSNPVSLAMSFTGGLLSFLSLLATKHLYGRVFSFCGISCVSAVFHALGQTLAAIIIMGDSAILGYLPVFAAFSSITGTVSGFIMNLIIPRLKAALSSMGLIFGR